MNQKSKDLIKRLVQIRKSSEVDADEMASVLDMSNEEYQKLERGAGEMTLSHLFRISEILKIEPTILFQETENTIHTDIPKGITEISFKITVKSQTPVDIESEIAKKFGLSRPTPAENFTTTKHRRQGPRKV
ncbi:helix-turn-helix domain-containing protein [Dyadobacter sp. OTU695]|uniref:helix-turn-helix domain-containing protein n=1 Tax=Dyadobacter sp. OTU695 TaxID=3043860 RepID=UPI00313DBF7D